MSKLDTSKTEWDLSPLLAGDDDPKIEEYRTKVTDSLNAFVAKWKNREDYLSDPKILREALDELNYWQSQVETGLEDYYFELRSSIDGEKDSVKAGLTKSGEFMKEKISELQFFWLKIGNIPADTQKTLLASPELEPYRHALETTFAGAKFKLSEPEERILLMKSSVSQENWWKMVENILSKEERTVLHEDHSSKPATLDLILTLVSSSNKEVRDEATKALTSILERWIDVAEAEFNSILEDKKINDRLRGYVRPDQSRHLVDDIDTEVVDAVVSAVAETNSLPYRYYQLKAKLLGLPKFKFHERNMSYGQADKDFTYEQSVELVHTSFNDLDPEFAELFEAFLDEGRIDVYPRKGKRGGAFCAYNGIAHPVYILLNHNNKLRDVTTLAHELGHGLNDEYMRRAQVELNYGTPMSTAEVASNFFEGCVFDRLLAEADDDLRLGLLMGDLNDKFASVHRQVGIYRFEQAIHEKFRKEGHLSHKQIGKLWQEYNESYMGPAVEQSPGSELSWMYIPHLRYLFYVYSYASGQLIAKAMQAKVKQDPAFIKEVKKFLSAGLSKSPKDIFADMGIDITDRSFWLEGLKEIEKQLDETEALAKKLGKI